MATQILPDRIAKIINPQATLGVTHISIACPYNDSSDYPTPPSDTIAYMSTWIDAIRAVGANVFYRGTDIFFEGLYSAPKRTPNTSPAIANGIAANVLNGSDTSSYLYRMWHFIKTHASLFADGDVWGCFPEPDGQGASGAAGDQFTNATTFSQWLVDLKTVADDAFSSIGKTVTTGMTSVNAGTAQGFVATSYWQSIGRCAIDLYWPYGDYGHFLDTVYSNAQVDVYLNEWGTLVAEEATTATWLNYDYMTRYFALFATKIYLKGISYFQSIGYAHQEDIIDGVTYLLLPQAKVIEKYFKNSPRIGV